MNNNRAVWVILLMILLGACFCCAFFAAVLAVRGLGWGVSSLQGIRGELTEQYSQTVDVRGAIALNLNVPIGDIIVRTGPADQVVVNATKRAWGVSRTSAREILDRISVGVEVAGDQVRITTTGLTDVRHVPRSPQLDIVISVPRDTRLSITSRVSQVLVAGTRGDVAIKVDVGSVTLTDVMPAAQLDIETRVASIELSGALAPKAAYTATSDVGRISFRLPADSAFKLDAKSDIGEVRLGYTVSGINDRAGVVGREVRGDVGSSPTTSLTLRSRVGEISVLPTE